MIRSGAVAYELLRPLDLYSLWYCRAVAWRTAPTTLRALPMFALALACLGMGWPASWASGAAWIAATAGALCLGCAITTLLTISLMWTISGVGISRLIFAGVILLSGMIVPLPFFPDWAQRILNVLPFRGLVDLPFRLYVGHIPPRQAITVLAHQAAWAVGLVVFGRWLLSRGLRRLVIQGG
jgi:ABC-2 type transport system permease protein